MQDLGPGVGLAWMFRISFIFLSEFLSPSLMFVGIEWSLGEGPHRLKPSLPQLAFMLRSFNKKLFGQKVCVYGGGLFCK